MGHENLERTMDVTPSSNRSFGVVFFVFFTLVGLWPLIHHAPVRAWALGVGAIFLATGLLRPQWLATPNRLWTKLGILMGMIVSPIALGILFYLVLTPIGLLVRWTGNDPLRLKRAPEQSSYWIEREPAGPAPDSMTNQF